MMAEFMHQELGHGEPTYMIPYQLFICMMNGNVHYHTPYHVLSMFEFARTHNLRLQPHEKLAIWFP